MLDERLVLAVLDGLVAKTADYLRIADIRGSKDKLRCFTSVEYRAGARSRRTRSTICC
jgi:hypothetical protein